MGARVRGKRSIAGASALAAVLTLGGAAWGARHEVSAGDPAGLTQSRAGVDYADGEAEAGHEVDVTPPETGSPSDPGPAGPPVEPPTVDAGPHLPDLSALPAWGIYVDASMAGTTVGDFALATVAGEDPFAGSRRRVWIAITVNPPGVPGAVSLFETNRANNTSYRKVQLLKGAMHVRSSK